MALFRRHVDAEATAFAWTRTVGMEQQQWVGRRSAWEPSGETRNVQRRQETYWETVTDWQPGPANADGTPGAQQPLTRQELRTRTFYTYEALEWRESRTLTASGADQSEVRWPEYTLVPGERVRSKAETYTGTFTAAARQYEATLGETQWRALALGTTYQLRLRLLGGVRDVTPI
ncbi:MAG TPA: hypothetical protein VI365_21910 [Trebonia sp.]